MPATSHYATAIDATRDTLTRRAAAYRNLVVAVVALAGLALTGVLVLARWWPLCLLLALPVAVLLFARHDAASVARWRRGILEAWASGYLQLHMLAITLRQVPGLPRTTLDGMLAALLALGPDEIPLPQRLEQVARQAREDDAAARRLLVHVALWFVAVAAITAAAIVF